MAIQAVEGKVGGNAQLVTVPVTVWDDTGADLSVDAAIAAALAEAPATILGQGPDDNPGTDQLNNSAWKITLNYAPRGIEFPQSPPVEQIQVDYRFSFQAKSKFVYRAEQCLGFYKFDNDSQATVEVQSENENAKLMVGVQLVGEVLHHKGMQVEPLPEVFALDILIPNAVITPTYQQRIEELCGCFNVSPFRGQPPGTIQLVRADGQVRTDEDWRLSLGFGKRKNRTNVSVGGGIIVPNVPGHALLWTVARQQQNATTKIREIVPRVAVLQRVWELDDLNDIQLPP